MKKTIILFTVLTFCFVHPTKTFADSYKVVKVLGTIIKKKTGEALHSGDIILSSDPIIFKTPDAKASVISSEKGRFVLAAASDNRVSDNVKSNLIPPMSNISSRAGAILNATDLQNSFGENFLLLKEAEISITKSAFPMNDDRFFFFTYKYEGEDINKKLKHKEDTLLLIEEELFMIDGKSFAHNESTFVKLSYSSDNKIILIGEFNILCPNNELLKEEVKIILDESLNKTYKEKLSDVLSYLNEFYGKVNEDNVKTWLSENLNLRK